MYTPLSSFAVFAVTIWRSPGEVDLEEGVLQIKFSELESVHEGTG